MISPKVAQSIKQAATPELAPKAEEPTKTTVKAEPKVEPKPATPSPRDIDDNA